jgi:hypothetical protein
MKRILGILTILCVISYGVNAQTAKGNIMMGASLADLSLSFQKGNTTFTGNISPKAGFFIKDNMAIGPDVNLGIITTQGASFFTYGVGAFGRKYFGDQALESVKNTRYFFEVNAGISGQSGGGASTTGLGLGAGPGLAYFISKTVALEALAKYNLTVGFGSSTTLNNIGVGLGFQIYLPGKATKNKVMNDVK